MTVATKALNAALNAIIIIAVVEGIKLLTKVIDDAITTTEEYREKLSDLKSELSETVNELKSLRDELSTTKSRMDELEAKGLGNLSFVEKTEYDNLKKTNTELERKIKLLEEEEKQKRKETNKTFVDTMKSDLKNKGEYSYSATNNEVTKGNSALLSFSGTVYTQAEEESYIKQQFEKRGKLYDELSNAETKEEQDRIQKQIDDIETYLWDKNTEFSDASNDINYISNPTTDDDKAVNEWLDYINDFKDKMAIEFSSDNESKQFAFDRLVDNWKFDEVTQELQDLGEQGKVTAEMLDDPKYDEFIKKLVELGIIDSADNLDDIALAFNKISDAVDDINNGNEISILSNTSRKEMIDNINSMSDGFDVLDKIYADVKDGDVFDFTNLDTKKFEEAFKDLDTEYEEFIETVSKSPNDINACQDAFNKLATAYINQKGILEDLNEENANVTVAMLQNMGIENAEEIVTERLTAKKEALALKEQALAAISSDSANATEKMSRDFVEQANMSDLARLELVDLIATEEVFANHDLKIGQKIDQLNALGEAYFGVSNAINGGMGTDSRFYNDTTAEGRLNEKWNTLISSQKEQYQPKYNYTGADQSNKTSSSGSTPNPKDYDWVEILLDRIQRKIKNFDKIATSTYKTLSTRSKAYKNEIQAVTKEINAQQAAYNKYMQTAESVDLDESYKNLIRNGGYETFRTTDKNLQDKLDLFKEYYDKALDAAEAKADAILKRTELHIDQIQTKIDNYAQDLEKYKNKVAYTEGRNSLRETLGQGASAGNYKTILNNTFAQIKNLDAQNDKIKKQAKEVKKNSQAWKEYQNQIKANNNEMLNLLNTMQETAIASRSISLNNANNKNDKINDRISLNEARSKNAIGATGKNGQLSLNRNSIIDQTANLKSAMDTTNANYASDQNSILNASQKGLTKSDKELVKKIKNNVKAGKIVTESQLKKLMDLRNKAKGKRKTSLDNLLTACTNWNGSVQAREDAQLAYEIQVEEQKQQLADLAVQKFQNVQTDYERQQNSIERRANAVNNKISLAEAKGRLTNSAYYQSLYNEENSKMNNLVAERIALQNQLNKAVASGDIKKYSDQWYTMVDSIDDVTEAIANSSVELENYLNDMRKASNEVFEFGQTLKSRFTSDNNFAIDILSRKDLASDDLGGLTENGRAVQALHAANYKAMKKQAEDYYKVILDYEKKIADNPGNKDLIEERDQYIDQYQDLIKGAYDELDALIDLQKQGYDALSNKIKDLIDEYTGLLDAEKEAYDYQKTIEEKTKNVAQLRKQLAVYKGDTSEEAKAQVQSISLSLKDAEKDLAEAQYEKYISDQKDMLSEFQADLADLIEDVIAELKDDNEILINSLLNDGGVIPTIRDGLADVSYKLDGSTLTNTLSKNTLLGGVNSSLTNIQDLIARLMNYSKSEQTASERDDILSAVNTSSVNAKQAKDYADIELYRRQETLSALENQAEAIQNVLDSKKFDYNDALRETNSAYGKYVNADNYAKSMKKVHGAKSSQYLMALTNKNNAQREYETQHANLIKIQDEINNWSNQLSAINKQIADMPSLINESKKKADSASVAYGNAQKIQEAANYLMNNLQLNDGSNGESNAINDALNNRYGSILSNDALAHLAQILGFSADYSKNGNLYNFLKNTLGIQGFYKGSRNITKDQLALLSERGQEIQYDTSAGVLKPIGKGDKIFTAEMSENLWKLAQMNPYDLLGGKTITTAPVSSGAMGNTEVTIDLGGINMYGVNDMEAFTAQLKTAINNNSSIQKLLINNTVGTLSNKYNSLSGKRY